MKKTNTLLTLIFPKMSLILTRYKKRKKRKKFGNIRVNKKEFHKSKPPINLDLIKTDQMVISDKFKHSDDGFKYFIGYKGGIVKRYALSYLK